MPYYSFKPEDMIKYRNFRVITRDQAESPKPAFVLDETFEGVKEVRFMFHMSDENWKIAEELMTHNGFCVVHPYMKLLSDIPEFG